MTNRVLNLYAKHETKIFAAYLDDIARIELENDMKHAKVFPLRMIRRAMQLAFMHSGSARAFLLAFDKQHASIKALNEWQKIQNRHFELYSILNKINQKYGFPIF